MLLSPRGISSSVGNDVLQHAESYELFAFGSREVMLTVDPEWHDSSIVQLDLPVIL